MTQMNVGEQREEAFSEQNGQYHYAVSSLVAEICLQSSRSSLH